MAAPTERIVVRVTPSQKRALNAVAMQLGMDVGELMVQAAQKLQARPYEGELEALVERVNASTHEAEHAIDDALRFVRESNQRIDAMSKRSH